MKKILITGAGSGLGAELAKLYGEEGNHIILVGRTLEKLERTASEVMAKGGSAECMIHDISNPKSVKEMVDKVVDKHNKLDYLINNAGIGFFGELGKITLEEIDTMLDVNVKGTIIVTQGLLPYINERIINIISTAGLRGKVNESVYVATKFAVRGFSESLQKELKDRGIDVTAVYMGGMNTPFWEDSDHIADASRLMSAEEVAREIKGKDDGREEIVIESGR